MRFFDLVEQFVCVVLIGAIFLGLGYVAVEQITYVGARSIKAISPVMPPTYEQKLKYLAELRLRGDEQSIQSIEVMEAKMTPAGQVFSYGR